MRALMWGVMVAGAMIGTTAAQDAGRRLFISPMGEPFRAGPDAVPPQDRWFDGADANHDGALSVEEMAADAARFFATLDVRHDGEIDPDDVQRYEIEIAPEAFGGVVKQDEHRRTYLKGDGSGVHNDTGADSPPDRVVRSVVRKGAARFGYLDYPQPIIVADRNFNRGVDSGEFAKAAETRFDMLDRNGDGRIERGELPKLPRR